MSPSRLAATSEAHAPVPHPKVGPTERSHVRTTSSSSDARLHQVTFILLGSSWGHIGWGLFLGYLIIPYLATASQGVRTGVEIAAVLGLLMLLWWIIDVVDQLVPWWMVITGVVMLLIGMLPRGGLLFLAAWVLYWTKVRE